MPYVLKAYYTGWGGYYGYGLWREGQKPAETGLTPDVAGVPPAESSDAINFE